MKRLLLVIFITILLGVFVMPIAAFAEEPQDTAEINAEFDELLDENDVGYSYSDIGGITFGSIVEKVRERLHDGGIKPLRLLGTLLLVIVLSSVVRSAGLGITSGNDNILSTASVLTAVTVITPVLFEVYERTLQAVRAGGGFIAVFIPVFTGVTAASGGVVSAGVYDISVLAASEVIVQLTTSYLMPIVSASTVLSVTGSIFSHTDLSGIVQLMKKVITWAMTTVMSLFIGFVTLKSSLAGKTDGAATKTVKMMISGFVPVVGGAVSDAYSTVRGSFDVVRGTIGTGGCIAIILILLPPVLQLIAIRAVIWTGAAAAELFGETAIKKLLDSLDSGLAIAQSVLICYGVMFVLCTGILMQTVG